MAGSTVDVLAMPLSIREEDRAMTGGHNWRECGFGDTVHARIGGGDGARRNDLRSLIEAPHRLYAARSVNQPYGLQGNIYVAESRGRRLQRFRFVSEG